MKIIKGSLILFTVLLYSISVFGQSKFTKRGDEYFNDFDFSRASETYKKAVGKDSSDMYAMHQIGECYRMVGDNASANPWYGRALNIDPESKLDLYFYARTLLTLGKYEEALQNFRKYNRLYPGDPRVQGYINSPRFLDDLTKDSLGYKVVTLPINSQMSEYGPSRFQNYLVFTSARERSRMERTSSWDNEPFLDIYLSELKMDNTLGEPQLIGDKIPTKFHVGSASFDRATDSIYFTRTSFDQNKVGADNQGVIKLDIYAAHYEGNLLWSENVAFAYNDKNNIIAQPAISFDGKKLYFVSDKSGGLGGTDIYVCERKGDKWGKPKNLGSPVNTSSHEKNPYIDSQGNLYFASTGHLGLGGLDIYIAKIKADGSFEAPVNLGYPVNTQYDDFSFTFQDNTELSFYFASNRPGGLGKDDIYKAYIQMKANTMQLTATILETLDNVPLKLEVYDENGNILAVETFMGTTTFEFEAVTKFPRFTVSFLEEEIEEPIERVNDIDVEPNSKGIYVLGEFELGEEILFEAKKITPEKHRIMTMKTPTDDAIFVMFSKGKEEVVEESAVYFEEEEEELKKVALDNLDFMIALATEDPDMVFLLPGLADFKKMGKEEALLAEQRRDNIYDYLIANGISPDRIEINTGVKKAVEEEPIEAPAVIAEQETKEEPKPEKPVVQKQKVVNVGAKPVYFSFDDTGLSQKTIDELKDLIVILNEKPDAHVEIAGYCDSRGPASYNLVLSKRRAQSVSDYLTKHGITANRISVVGYGETKLINRCSDGVKCSSAEHAQNRRVEFKVLENVVDQ